MEATVWLSTLSCQHSASPNQMKLAIHKSLLVQDTQPPGNPANLNYLHPEEKIMHQFQVK